MTLDSFGLWDIHQPDIVTGAASTAEGLSFSLPGTEPQAAVPQQSVAVWRVTDPQDLALRASRVQALDVGLASARQRVGTFIEALPARKAQAQQVSFSTHAPQPVAQLPEDRLFQTLIAGEAAQAGQSAVSFGLTDSLPGGVDWDSLLARFNQWMEGMNRQLLHFVWVDTLAHDHLMARTSIQWGGDMLNIWADGIGPGEKELHVRSLSVALDSRQQNIQMVTTVAKTAASLALAFTAPLGAGRLLALSWQFIHEILLPFIENPQTS